MTAEWSIPPPESNKDQANTPEPRKRQIFHMNMYEGDETFAMLRNQPLFAEEDPDLVLNTPQIPEEGYFNPACETIEYSMNSAPLEIFFNRITLFRQRICQILLKN